MAQAAGGGARVGSVAPSAAAPSGSDVPDADVPDADVPDADARAASAGWVPNFAAILLCHVAIFAMFQSVMPFLPLFLRELGEDEAGAVLWAGVMQSSTAGVLLVVTPLWGAVADRVGRKVMVIRALFGAMTVMTLMGFATAAWQLAVLRLLQGATAGTNSAVIALAASVVPTSRLGMSMGLLQTAQFLGISIGPLIGGVAAATFGFRGTFWVTSGVLLVLTLLVAVLVREPARRAARAGRPMGLRQRLLLVGRAPRLRAPILTILAFQAAWATGVTLLPLHLAAVVGGSGELDPATTQSVGLVLSTTALGVATGAAGLGWLGGRVGAHRVALGSIAATALLTLPQMWYTQPWQFAATRFFLGLAAGGVMPSLRAVMGQEAARDEAMADSLGAVYGLGQSAFAGGMTVGPALASLVASVWGLPATHAASAALLALSAAWWVFVSRPGAAPATARPEPRASAA